MSRRLATGLRRRAWARLLTLQGSWNPQRMQNLGLVFCMLPWLRDRRWDVDARRRFFRRYFDYFNTNPYLAGFLVGGLLRLEEDRAAGDASLTRAMLATYRDSLGRAFASLGDQLFWLGLRPGVTLVACLWALRGSVAGVLATFLVFLAGQLTLRWWSLQAGYGSGLDIPVLLGNPLWHRVIALAKRTALVCLGFLAVVLAVGYPRAGEGSGGLVLGLGALLGWFAPRLLKRRLPGEGLGLLASLLAAVVGFALLVTGG